MVCLLSSNCFRMGPFTLNCAGLYNLRDVYLSSVIVLADVLELMLTRFPLERVHIELACVGSLSISGVAVRLNSLKLVSCVLDDLKISAPSLTSLTYEGPESSLVLEHVPLLSELSVDEEFCTTFLQTGFINMGYISRLKRLEIVMSEEAVRESVNYPLELPEIPNLEELKVEIRGEKDSCLLWPVLMIKAAPFLRKFSAKLFMAPSDDYERPSQLYEGIRNAAKRVQHHQYLKTVELHNYFTCSSGSELVRHLLGVSETLEQILVAPIYFGRDAKTISKLRSQAEAIIAEWLPPSSKAKLIVL